MTVQLFRLPLVLLEPLIKQSDKDPDIYSRFMCLPAGLDAARGGWMTLQGRLSWVRQFGFRGRLSFHLQGSSAYQRQADNILCGGEE